jgi:hypothetical protein
MVTFVVPSMELGHILQTTPSKSYVRALFKDGVRGKSTNNFSCLHMRLTLSFRCSARWDNLDGEGGRCSHELTLALFDVLDKKRLWDDYGIVDDIMVYYFSFLLCQLDMK